MYIPSVVVHGNIFTWNMKMDIINISYRCRSIFEKDLVSKQRFIHKQPRTRKQSRQQRYNVKVIRLFERDLVL